MFGIIKLDKVFLRALKDNDYLDLYDYFKDPKTSYFSNFRPLKTSIDAKLVVSSLVERDAQAIVLKENKKVIGHFLTKIKNFEYYIEFSINPNYIDYSYLNVVLNYAVNHIKADKVYCLVHEENLASRNILEKNGFNVVDEIRNEDINHDVVNFKKYMRVK